MRIFQVILFFVLCAIQVVSFADPGKKPLTHQAAVVIHSEKISYPLNINTATRKTLEAVPGLNASKARAILAWRKKNGAFKTLDTLRQVSGFKRMNAENFKVITAKLSVS